MNPAADLLMPKLGLTMTEGTVAQWVAKVGEPFAPPDILLVVETDKIANEIEAPAAGRLLDILVPAGATVAVGTPIATWTADGGASRTSASRPKPSTTSESVPTPAPTRAPVVATMAPLEPTRRRLVVTPLARRRARAMGLDLRQIKGSGPGGRIKAADIERQLSLAIQATAEAATPQSLSQFRMSAEVDLSASAVLAARLADEDIEPLHIVLAAVAWAWRDIDDEPLAVDLTRPDSPIRHLGDLRGLRLTGIARRMDENNASVGRLTVIDAGPAGPEDVAPAVRPGQMAALGIGAPRPAADGRQPLRLTLCGDARRIDEAAAIRVMDRLRAALATPILLLL